MSKLIGFFLIFSCQVLYAADSELAVDRLRFGLGASYGFNGLMKFDPVAYSDASIPEKTAAEFKFSNAVALEVEIRSTNIYSLGFMAEATFDQLRSVTEGKMTGVTKTWLLPKGTDLTLQVSTYYLSAIYRSDEFYFPFGLNISTVQMKSGDGQFGQLTAQGGLGWQLGFGFYLTDDIVFEFISRKAAYKLKAELANGATIDFGQGGFTNILLTAKYLF